LAQTTTYQRQRLSQSSLLDEKIDKITEALPASYANKLKASQQISIETVTTIIDYIAAMKSEINLSDHYRKDLIEVLTRFSKYLDYKPFKDLTRDNIIAFLDTFRRPEAIDPQYKWIGTYNVYRIHLMRFFKWLYAPDIEHTKREKPKCYS
jgi:hypothetical protein